jgi:hypothetical protein
MQGQLFFYIFVLTFYNVFPTSPILATYPARVLLLRVMSLLVFGNEH